MKHGFLISAFCFPNFCFSSAAFSLQFSGDIARRFDGMAETAGIKRRSNSSRHGLEMGVSS
jgi:hypothetical protein